MLDELATSPGYPGVAHPRLYVVELYLDYDKIKPLVVEVTWIPRK